MKLVEELKRISDESVIAVLTGNGRMELRVLKSFAEKYDGTKKVLFFPGFAIHPRPGSGLRALKAVKTYLNYKITSTLFLVDKEHFCQEDVREEINGALRSFGIDIRSLKLFQSLGEDALLINGSVGHREVAIYTVILGKEKNIEEDITKLIELELGVKIDPKKQDIRNTLHKQGIDINTLVKNARSTNLKTAFPGLNLILNKVEKNDCEQRPE